MGAGVDEVVNGRAQHPWRIGREALQGWICFAAGGGPSLQLLTKVVSPHRRVGEQEKAPFRIAERGFLLVQSDYSATTLTARSLPGSLGSGSVS